MLMGSASTVTMVRMKTLRLVSSLTCAAISSCSSLMRSLSADMSRMVSENSSVGLAQLLEVALVDPGRRQAQQAKQRARLGRQQALQPHQHAAQLAQVGAAVVQPAHQEFVFDHVDLHGRVAHDAHQHVALLAQQVVQEGHRRRQRLAVLDRHRAARSMERSGCERALSAMCGATLSHRLDISAGSKANS
jgi:hypothetical protein